MNDVFVMQHVASIVAIYLEHNIVSPVVLPRLVADVKSALMSAPAPMSDVMSGVFEPEDRFSPEVGNGQEPERCKTPAIPIDGSVCSDHLLCIECGNPFTSLKRHLQACHKLTPDEYRAKWNLPADYPMVSEGYSKSRSKLAKKSGFGGRTAKKEADIIPAKTSRGNGKR